MGTRTEDFLAEMLPKIHAAEVAFRNGDPAPRLALWARAEPTSWLGQYGTFVTGIGPIADHFTWVASRFSDVSDYRLQLLAADVIGEAAYTVGLERSLSYFDGKAGAAKAYRVSRIYRREGNQWLIAHGHGDVAPPDAGSVSPRGGRQT